MTSSVSLMSLDSAVPKVEDIFRVTVPLIIAAAGSASPYTPGHKVGFVFTVRKAATSSISWSSTRDVTTKLLSSTSPTEWVFLIGGGKTLTPEEIAQREADMAEKVLVEDMLTEAAKWYNEQLQKYPDILDHLKDKNYGFSDDIINQLKIGFSPVSTRCDGTSELADHLNSFPEFKRKILLTGLFSVDGLSRCYDYFKGRIVFPTGAGGKAYMLARVTGKTPVDKYEFYVESDGVTLKEIKWEAYIRQVQEAPDP